MLVLFLAHSGVLETTQSRPASQEYNLYSHTGVCAYKDLGDPTLRRRTPHLEKPHTWFNVLLSSS